MRPRAGTPSATSTASVTLHPRRAANTPLTVSPTAATADRTAANSSGPVCAPGLVRRAWCDGLASRFPGSHLRAGPARRRRRLPDREPRSWTDGASRHHARLRLARLRFGVSGHGPSRWTGAAPADPATAWARRFGSTVLARPSHKIFPAPLLLMLWGRLRVFERWDDSIIAPEIAPQRGGEPPPHSSKDGTTPSSHHPPRLRRFVRPRHFTAPMARPHSRHTTCPQPSRTMPAGPALQLG